jgi:hypothetical protein
MQRDLTGELEYGITSFCGQKHQHIDENLLCLASIALYAAADILSSQTWYTQFCTHLHACRDPKIVRGIALENYGTV